MGAAASPARTERVGGRRRRMAALQKAHVLGRPMLLEYREDQGGKPLNQRLE